MESKRAPCGGTLTCRALQSLFLHQDGVPHSSSGFNPRRLGGSAEDTLPGGVEGSLRCLLQIQLPASILVPAPHSRQHGAHLGATGLTCLHFPQGSPGKGADGMPS